MQVTDDVVQYDEVALAPPLVQLSILYYEVDSCLPLLGEVLVGDLAVYPPMRLDVQF